MRLIKEVQQKFGRLANWGTEPALRLEEANKPSNQEREYKSNIMILETTPAQAQASPGTTPKTLYLRGPGPVPA